MLEKDVGIMFNITDDIHYVYNMYLNAPYLLTDLSSLDRSINNINSFLY